MSFRKPSLLPVSSAHKICLPLHSAWLKLGASPVQPTPGTRRVSAELLPRRERGSSFLLAWCIHVAHSKMLSDLLHVFKVKECIKTGFVYNNKKKK